MDTPASILTSKQREKSLSARKKVPKKPTKTVLASPFDTSWWPIVDADDVDTIQGVLNRCLPRLRPQKPIIPYAQIKSIPREHRSIYRGQLEIRTGICPVASTLIRLGVNDVTKALQDNDVTLYFVLITSDVTPQLMVNHVIDVALLKDVPVLVVPELRNILKTKCGVGGTCLALVSSDDIKLTDDLQAIVTVVETVRHRCRIISKHHMHYNRRPAFVSELTPTTCDDDNDVDSDEPVNKRIKLERSPSYIDLVTDNDDDSMSDVPQTVRQYHLSRVSTNQRAFVPPPAPPSSPQKVSILKGPPAIVKFKNVPQYKATIARVLKANAQREGRKIATIAKTRKKAKKVKRSKPPICTNPDPEVVTILSD